MMFGLGPSGLAVRGSFPPGNPSAIPTGCLVSQTCPETYVHTSMESFLLPNSTNGATIHVAADLGSSVKRINLLACLINDISMESG